MATASCSVTWPRTMASVDRMALLIAFSSLRPWHSMTTPLTPARSAPPVSL